MSRWINSIKISRPSSDDGSVSLYLVLMMVAFAGAVISVYLHLFSSLDQSSTANLKNKMRNVDSESAMETFVQAYRWAEMTYVQSNAACGTARSFVNALKDGSGCPGAVSVFSTSSGASDPGVTENIYSYAGAGCTISTNSSTCGDPAQILFTMGVTDSAQKIGGKSFSVSLARSWPELKASEFVLAEQGDLVAGSVRFFVRASLENSAHLQADGSVVQENPNPTSRCYNDPWAEYKIFDESTGTCVKFAQLGSGTGLAFYKNRFFGFRPSDGLIIDLLSIANTLPSYVVNDTNGTVGGMADPVFVPYPSPAVPNQALLNVDDITMVDNQIYYVSGMGGSAEIGYAAANGARIEVCNLGGMGWSQSYAGIAATGWSDPLISDPTHPLNSYMKQRFATFFLKSDAGDLFTAYVINPGNGTYQCYVTKDAAIQQVEYERTLGFDRTQTTKPFYVF